jgi:hypothetical protein
MPLWDETHGDRQTEVVVIGRHMDRERVEAALRSCLLSEKELAALDPETWDERFGDPWEWAHLIVLEHADEEGGAHGHGHGHSHEHSH